MKHAPSSTTSLSSSGNLAAPSYGHLLWLVQRAYGIRHPNSGPWTRAQTAQSWADWDRQAFAAIGCAASAPKSDRKRRHVVTADDLPVSANVSETLDTLANYFARPFRDKGRGYGGTVDGKPQSGHWLRVTCRPSELRAAIARATGGEESGK